MQLGDSFSGRLDSFWCLIACALPFHCCEVLQHAKKQLFSSGVAPGTFQPKNLVLSLLLLFFFFGNYVFTGKTPSTPSTSQEQTSNEILATTTSGQRADWFSIHPAAVCHFMRLCWVPQGVTPIPLTVPGCCCRRRLLGGDHPRLDDRLLFREWWSRTWCKGS